MRFEVCIYFTMDSSRGDNGGLTADIEADNFSEAEKIADEMSAQVTKGTGWTAGHILICQRAKS